ncbi:MAG: alpha/beta hydrolase fold domain-containing protein [Gemmatimonas sp.]|nr:alpha/beta hydrolase fold domain-containing protein [Gemmatimonas sp.]
MTYSSGPPRNCAGGRQVRTNSNLEESHMRAVIPTLIVILGGLTFSDALAQDRAEVVVETDAVYSLDEGSALLADLAYPEGESGLPAIIYVHGGRWRGGTRDNENALDVADWAASGYFAMTIDYRLVGGSPAPAPYQDVLSAIRYVHAHADQYGIDTNRIYLIGNSSGGHLVALVATLGPGSYPITGSWPDASMDVRAAISVAGTYDLNTLSWGDLWTPVSGDVQEARRVASPIRAVDADTKPILVIHSDDDGSVPVQQAVDMVGVLQAAGVPHQFVHWQDRGHMSITEEVVQETHDFIAWLEDQDQ